MKAIYKRSTMLLLALLAASSAFAFSLNIEDEEQTDTINYNVYRGEIMDASNNTPLPFATIEVEGLNIATVSNIDGEFTLKIPEELSASKVKVSYVGYKNATASIEDLSSKKEYKIKLEPTSVALQEVTIRAGDALSLVRKVFANVKDNYSNDDMMMTAFYRETIKRRRNYVAIAEAVVDIYKGSYTNNFRYDQSKLIQGRKSADVSKMDTVLFKVQGGPATILLLDIIKNPYILLSEEYHKIYNFTLTGVISLNDRLHYVVSFDQKPHVTAPFYKGKFYIDMDRLAITETEFELNLENELEVAGMFVRKKPAGMNVKAEKTAYRARYTIEDDNTWFFNYARAEVRFQVSWKKKLFNTNYTTMSEIVITDRSDQAVERIPTNERFRRSQVLDELVFVFFDQDFWGGYNVIEPDQSIESAIKRLNKKFLKTSEESTIP